MGLITLMKNEVVNKLGRNNFLDEEYGKGYGDDIDLTYRMMNAGYKLVSAYSWIDHHRMTEHYNNDDIEVEELKKKNSKYFKKKFGIGEK